MATFFNWQSNRREWPKGKNPQQGSRKDGSCREPKKPGRAEEWPPMLHFAAYHKFWDLPAGPTQWCQSNLRQGTSLPTYVQHRCCSSDISCRNGFQDVYLWTTSQGNRGERWHPTKEPGRWHATLATKMDHIGLHTLMVINASTTGVFYCFSIIMSPNDEHKHTETHRHTHTFGGPFI